MFSRRRRRRYNNTVFLFFLFFFMTETTTQDGDGDGILDANDNCPNLTHTSCYKEGDTAVVVHSNG